MILLFADSDGVASDIARALTDAGRSVEVDSGTDLRSMKDVRAVVVEHGPEAVVVCGGLEGVDACELDPERAFQDNAEVAIHLAAAALEVGAVPVLISSPEVFGARGGPWMESDEVAPLSTYARTKLQGEKFLSRAAKTALIIRAGPIVTSSLTRERRRLASGEAQEASDERVTPTAASDLGWVIDRLLKAGAQGLFHVAGPGDPVTRADYLRAVAARVAPGAAVSAKPGRDLRRKASHAPSATLLAEKLKPHLDRALTPWRDVVDQATTAPDGEREKPMGQRGEVRRVDKPWGHEIIWAVTERYVGKILFIKQGERLSLQYHERKDETVYVLSGKMVFEVGPKDGDREDLILKPGDSYHVTPETVHRMIALEDTQVLEASTPELDDVVRLEDSYGRAGTKEP